MSETLIARPVEIADPLLNPDCGWGIWLGAVSPGGPEEYNVADMTTGFGDDAPLFSFACIDWYWRLLEPREGEFHWEDLDAVVNYWTARGKQINMRLWTTYEPGWAGKGGAPVAPDWLFDRAGCRHFNVPYPFGGEPAGAIRAPDYADPVYLEKLRNFVAAAKERYEPEPSLDFIGWQAASYGPWGEWHESSGGSGYYAWPGDKAEHETCVAMQNIYKDLLGSRCQISLHGNCKFGKPADMSYETWKYQVGMDEAAANGWVLGRHSCLVEKKLVEMFGKPRPWIALKGRVLDEYWPSNVHYGEANLLYATLVNGGGGGLEANLDGAVAMHFNWVHQYMTGEQYRKNPNQAFFERGLKAGGLGYRFVLLEAEYPARAAAGSTFALKQKWANRNAGRGWRRYPLAVYLADSSSGRVVAGPLVDEAFDQTMWIAGQTYDVSSRFAVPPDVPDGTYDLRVAMVDSSRTPRIRLAIEEGDTDLRYRVGQIRIT